MTSAASRRVPAASGPPGSGASGATLFDGYEADSPAASPRLGMTTGSSGGGGGGGSGHAMAPSHSPHAFAPDADIGHGFPSQHSAQPSNSLADLGLGGDDVGVGAGAGAGDDYGNGYGNGYGGGYGKANGYGEDYGGHGMAPSPLAHSAFSGGRRLRSAAGDDAFMPLAVRIGLGVAAAVEVLALLGCPWDVFFYVTVALAATAGGLLFVLLLTRDILSKSRGSAAMQVIADAIQEGAEGFLTTQYRAIAKMAVVTAVVLVAIYALRSKPVLDPREARPTSMASLEVSTAGLAFVTAFSFVVGAACSALAGYIGVWVSVRANLRVASAAGDMDFSSALLLSFRGGAVSAMLSAALCVLGLTTLFVAYFVFFGMTAGINVAQVPFLLVGYGFGASFVALFMQLGGGIYTKAADVGADLVGKVESGIPEDDPRNPAVIADLVGDNVGDCAGAMADVFESIAAEVIGTMLLGGVLADDGGLADSAPFIFFALVIHAFDMVVSGVGVYMVRASRDANASPLAALKRGYMITTPLALVGYVLVTRLMLYTPQAPSAWMHFAGCGVIGIAMANALILTTQYYTDYGYGPVRSIAAASTTGHGTNVIAGIAVGFESTGLPTVVISLSLLTCYVLGHTSGIDSRNAGLFGTACGTMGMLCTAVYVLAMNNMGAISDNAGGIVEMSNAPAEIRAITDSLDAVGNVTKAATKGYAVGGSALATFVLFRAFLDEVGEYRGVPFETVNIASVEVLVGGLLGIMTVFVFSAWAIKAVGDTAQEVIIEVRRQFKADPGIMAGTSKPDYGGCVAIVTQAALVSMRKPALFALGMPVAVALFFRTFAAITGFPNLAAEVLASFLVFSALAGLLTATFFDNAGGAWDNAKKWIEAGAHGGSGSDAHAAAVTGDTVGDPFKDTAGPALHVIITTTSTLALVLGPLILQ
ncbi:H-translocating Pyrophosphatase family [Thecamonas trahens ATCC 50062]|uniref:H(+)-exporting diphosphatase n=1 Tax=Thecamonas trahens ATCC 50062 TaxID=461836 RepID=A0A0L0DGT5_THETB|nr:H-translocating Pyrophosphatase family [Thecamonas trahens ATCC 50062]KNC51554.1 H-translocating Pyrophosphatase family [Thecamonas trahens ATCC 50062]|eukprot:XP_013755956.1 H-translocating Pyrophosphatase family [Thecamonas trahens ATCC 50062]